MTEMIARPIAAMVWFAFPIDCDMFTRPFVSRVFESERMPLSVSDRVFWGVQKKGWGAFRHPSPTAIGLK